MTSRKTAYFIKIREDYAYKYSSALAFEGYKKQTQEISPELQKHLLSIAVTNLGDNPTRLFSDKVKHTPLNCEKIATDLKDFFESKIDGSLEFFKSKMR